MIAVERDNPALKDVLPKEYGRDALDQRRPGLVVDLVSNIRVGGETHATDVLGQMYEYFLEQFALAEGRKGSEFYTPRSVVRLLVEMREPDQGRVYDLCCGSLGMFVQAVEFIHAHATGNGNDGKARGDISIYLAAGPDEPGQRLHVFEPVGRGPDPREHHRSRTGGLHHRPAGAALPIDADTGLPGVPVPGTKRRKPPAGNPVHRRPQDGQHGEPDPAGPVPQEYIPHRRRLPS